MNERLVLRGIEFSWDERKAATNEARHGVPFRLAAEVFFDPLFRVEDATKAAHEVRQAILGMTRDWKVLYVVFSETTAGVRVISARQATKQERKRYEDQ